MLLRRVWNSLRKSSPSQNSEDTAPGELSPAENLSADLFELILQRLGPRGSARAAVICRTWRNFVEDERLWESFLKEECGEVWQATVFAETYLRAGLPLRSVIPSELTHLPFREIYSQQAHLQRSVIIDGGSGYCKYGWSTNSGPSGRSATFLEFGNIESPMHSKLRHFFLTIYRKLNVKPLAQPLVISTPICHCDDTESDKAARHQLREAIYQVLFDMNVPAICAIDQRNQVVAEKAWEEPTTRLVAIEASQAPQQSAWELEWATLIAQLEAVKQEKESERTTFLCELEEAKQEKGRLQKESEAKVLELGNIAEMMRTTLEIQM